MNGITSVDLCLQPLRVVWLGQTSGSDKKTYSLAIRILASLACIAIFPVILAAFAFKWWRGESWQKNSRNLVEQPKAITAVPPPVPAKISDKEEKLNRDVVNQILKAQLAAVQHLDVKLEPPKASTWRAHASDETNQSFDDFLTFKEGALWPDQRPLAIQLIGSFDDTDKKIIAITLDFLEQFHQIRIHLENNVMTMNEIKAQWLNDPETIKFYNEGVTYYHKRAADSFPRQNGQFSGELALDMMENVVKPKIENEIKVECNLIAFTSDDLYTLSCSNFVFGCAYLHTDIGIWSKSRFGDPKKDAASFEKCLLRMMKISAHEFGHMRGIQHCTDYECNMGGYLHLPELDSRPLIYCLQDTAKICSLGQTSLLSYQQKLLQFFEGFNQKYSLNCDFSNEIATLKKRVATLQL